MLKVLLTLVIIPLAIFAAEWQALNSPSAGYAHDLAIGWDGFHGYWINYAIKSRGMMYKTTNDGDLWYPITDERINQSTDVVTEPNNAQIVYLVEWENDFDEHPIWKSNDGGNTWNWIDDINITNHHFDCIAMDPNNTNILYVGADCWQLQPSVFKTTNGGQSWQAKRIGSYDPWIRDITVMSSGINSIVLAASTYASSTRGIWRSTNGGNTWRLRLNVGILSVELFNMNIAYAGSEGNGVYKSTNGGYDWFHLDSSPPYSIYGIKAITANIVYVATGSGIFKSTDGGNTWYPLDNGLRCKACMCISNHPNDFNYLFVGADWCIYKSTNAGNNWTEITNGYSPAFLKKLTTKLPDIYCLGNSISPINYNASSIFRSSDYGNSWQTLVGAFTWEGGDIGPSVIRACPNASNLVLFGGKEETQPELNEKGVIFRTWDYGENWDRVYKPIGNDYDFINALDFSPLHPATVFAGYDGTTDHAPIKKSVNAGATWISKSMPNNPSVYSLGIDPINENILYSGTKSYGVYKSYDNGENWIQTSLANVDVNALLIDPDYPDTMYAGSNNPNGVYKTNDGSLHWQPVNNGLDYQYIMDFAIDPSEPTLFYSLCKANAAASQTYVYCTVDRGAKWFDVTTGIPGEIKAWDLEIDPTVVDPVFAATDKGLYTYTPDFDKHLVSSSGIATDANNGRKLIRICETDHLWTVYESGGVIYAVHSTDRGQTWSKKMEIGRGLNPCVAAQPGIIDYPPMGIAWRRGTLVQDTIYYAYYLGDHAWSNPYMIAVSGGLFPFDPPSLAIDDQGFCHVAYANNGSINHAWFEAMDPGSSSSETIITGLSNQNPKNPCIGFLSSEVNPNLHVVWENDAVIYYSYRAGDPAVWSYSEVVSNDGFLTLNSCHHPSLEISGDVVYVVWDGRDESANQDIYWRNLSWIDGTPYWSWIWYVCSTEAASEYPVLASGFYCSWVEDGNEVYYAYYDPFMWVWTGQTNLSQSANLSGYPHLAYQQTWDATHIYFIWTENNTAPYHIEFRDIQFGGGGGGAGFLGESGSDALGFYSAEAGKETKSAFNLKRTGIKNYGNEPYKKADYDDQYLEYKFSNLNPDKDYGIKVKFYQHGNNNLPLTVKINNVSFGSINIPQDSLITFQKQIPAILYKNKVIDIKIYGSQALSGTIVLYEYERDKPKGGGSQDANTTPLNGGKLGLNIYPVPAWNDFTIDYVLPYKISIRICLYDVSGRLIAVPVSEARRPGRYEQRLKTDDLPQGVYFLRFEAGDQVTVRKVTVLK